MTTDLTTRPEPPPTPEALIEEVARLKAEIQWRKLNAFLQDGRLELDNNRSERAIKPFVIGRKNWLFANTLAGARSSATIYSLVETAKENGLNPLTYLTYLFERLPNINLKDTTAVDELLPWSAEVQSRCHVPVKPARPSSS